MEMGRESRFGLTLNELQVYLETVPVESQRRKLLEIPIIVVIRERMVKLSSSDHSIPTKHHLLENHQTDCDAQ